MAADGSDAASFTVRLINAVTAPARSIQQSMAGVTKSMQSAQRAMAAPAPKRGGISEWDKMLGGAKKSQALDFAKQGTAAARARQKEEKKSAVEAAREATKTARKQELQQKKSADISKRLAQDHADHGLPAMLAEGGSSLALGATAAIGAAAVGAAAAVGYMGYKFTEASVQAGIFAEKSELAIGFLTNNAPQAAQQFDQVRHMAQTLGLEVNETIGSFERLLAMQFDIGKSKDLIKMAADMQAIGASGEEVQRILYAISEIKSMGTLQKRQERMLQMAGISGQLIDAALMKHTGITNETALNKARSKNQIGADVAVDAIMEAVMHKTHESKLGEAGAAFATETVAGMTASFHAKLDNLFTDVGKLLMPGVVRVFGLFSDIFTAITTDPKIIGVGQFLLDTFNSFTAWVDQNWGAIVSTFVTGAEWLASSIQFVVGMFDSATLQGKVTIGVLETIAAVFALVAVAGFVMMAPLYALIALVGLVVYAIDWLAGKIKALGEWIIFGGSGANDATAAVDAAKLPQVTDVNGYTVGGSGANDNSIQGTRASSGLSALQGMADATESGSRVDSHAVDMSGMVINVTSPEGTSPEQMAQRIHSEVAKIMRQANG